MDVGGDLNHLFGTEVGSVRFFFVARHVHVEQVFAFGEPVTANPFIFLREVVQELLCLRARDPESGRRV